MSHLAARTTLFFVVCLGLCANLPEDSVWAEPVTTIRNNGDSGNRVDIAIMGDGYTAGELAKYATDIETFVQGLLRKNRSRNTDGFSTSTVSM